jgi:hypothetical protein
MQRHIKAQKVKTGIVLMLLCALCVWQRHFVLSGWLANIYLNSLIFCVFLCGVVLAALAFRSLGPELIAFSALQEAFSDIRISLRNAAPDPFWRHERCLEKGVVFGKPKLLGHVYELTIEELRRTKHLRISLATMESLVGAIVSKMVHQRALPQYIVGLLVFLGLIGTFIGLMEMVQSVGGIIGGLAGADASSDDAFRKLLKDLEAPLTGMATGFSASLFGLFGSLVLGLIGRFVGSATYVIKEEFEAWLADVAQIESSARGVGSEFAGLDVSAATALAVTVGGAAQSLDRNARAIEALVVSQGEQRTLALATYGVLEKLVAEQGDTKRLLASVESPLRELTGGLKQGIAHLRTGIESGFGRAVDRIERVLDRNRDALERRIANIAETQTILTRFTQTIQGAMEGELTILAQAVERLRSHQDDQAERLEMARRDILATIHSLDARADLSQELTTIMTGVESALATSVADLGHGVTASISSLAEGLDRIAQRQAHAAAHLESLQDARFAPNEVRAMTQALETGMAAGFTEVCRAIASTLQFQELRARDGGDPSRKTDRADSDLATDSEPSRRESARAASSIGRELDVHSSASLDEFYARARIRLANDAA